MKYKGVDSKLLKAMFYKDGLVTSCIHMPANDTDFFKTTKGRKVRGECISKIITTLGHGNIALFSKLKKLFLKQLLKENSEFKNSNGK